MASVEPRRYASVTLPLFQYQADIAAVMAVRERFGLHDEMGIGKTASTIGAINHSLSERGIVVCPAMLRDNWIKEFAKFSTYKLRICKGKTIHDFVAWSRGRFDVLILSYEQATKWISEFQRAGEYLEFIAFDEAHYLKNVNANRTRALLGHEASGKDGLVEWTERAWHITGTPMANDPLDIFTFLRFAKAIDMDSDEFVKYFFIKRLTRFGARHFPKDDMVPTLTQLIYNNAVRRTHEDVGMQLPPIWLTEAVIEGETIEINEALAGYPNLENIIVYALESGDISALDAPHIATVRRLVGKAKAVAYAALLKMELDGGAGKRVAFFVHTEPLLYVARYMRRFGYNVVVVYGDMPDGERQKAVASFMEDPSVVCFLANMRVAGVGLTLTSSSTIDVVESSWSPSDNAQAIKRVHRYGQLQDVHARFITLANSIDEVVNGVVAQKTAAIAKVEGRTRLDVAH